jgi:hypothetical protein
MHGRPYSSKSDRGARGHRSPGDWALRPLARKLASRQSPELCCLTSEVLSYGVDLPPRQLLQRDMSEMLVLCIRAGQ